MSLEVDRPDRAFDNRGARERSGLRFGWILFLSALAAVVAVALVPSIRGYFQHLDEERAKRTIIAIREIGQAAEAYAVEHGRYPAPVGSVIPGWAEGRGPNALPSPVAWPVRASQRAAALRPLLVPRYLSRFSGEDAWGRAILYATSQDGKAYTVVSTGRDGRLDTIRSITPGPIWNLDRDLVYADGYLFTWFYN